ncbi:MAG: MFS transporter [Candidatus Methylomirabilales bacterium]
MTPLALLFALAFLVSVDVRILAPVLPSIAASLRDTPGSVGLAMTAFSMTYGTSALIYGPISDRFGRIPVVRAAGLGFSLCTVLAAWAQSTPQFVGARLLAGAFAGAVIPLTLVFIGDTVAYERRQIVLGRFSAITSAALAFSASIGGALAYAVSWRAMLTGYAMAALLPVALLWRLPAASQGRPARRPGAVRFQDFLRDRHARAVYVAVFLEGFLLWGGVTYLGAFAAHRHGLNQLAIGLLLALLGVATMSGGLLMGRLRGRLSEGQLAGFGGTAMGAGFLLLVPRWPWPVFGLAMLPLGLGLACLHTTLQVRGTEISPAARGKAFALFAVSLFTGIAAGTAALGRLVDAGRYEAVLVLAGLGLVLIGLGTAQSGKRAAAPRPA